MEKYVVLRISVPEEEHDLFYAIAAEWPCDVFWEDGDDIVTSIKFEDFDVALLESFKQDLRPYGWEIITETAESANWNKEWEVNFEPVEVEDFVRIRAPFHEPVAGFKHEILMEPKMAFGTGHHETTFMMLRFMKQMDFEGKEVWDFGCGTAILGIVAALEGAVYVFANDIEKPAVASSIDNAEVNGAVVHVVEGGIETVADSTTFDVIIANITRNVLLESSETISKKINKGGILLLSGILIEDIEMILKNFSSYGFDHLETQERGKWAALKFEYNN